MNKKIEELTKNLLLELKIDISDPNFVETPKRVARMYDEIFEGLSPKSEEEIETQLSKTFPCDNNEMITIPNILCWSMCPHHFLPVKYDVCIGYIPDKMVLGLSKLPRLAILLAKRPVLQEQLTYDICMYLEKHAEPLGAIVTISGEHLCMQMRGVKATGCKAITTSVTGLFSTNDRGCKDEFLSRIGK
jgi:GTP cyclohydrolase I